MSASEKSKAKVGALSPVHLRNRGNELRPVGFKNVRYSVGLFISKYGDRPVGSLRREDGLENHHFLEYLVRYVHSFIGIEVAFNNWNAS